MSFRFEHFFTFGVAAAAAFTVGGGKADARTKPTLDPAHIVMIQGTSPTLAPFQHVRFCRQYPDDCRASHDTNTRIELDDDVMKLLKQVNHHVNLTIQATSKSYGANLSEGWSIAPELGDCNDYAVTKRHELLALGLPSAALRLSVVRTSWGEGHLVLTVATTKGDLVLDNLTETIRSWRNTDYQWIKIQSAANPKFWNDVGSMIVNASLLHPATAMPISIPEQKLGGDAAAAPIAASAPQPASDQQTGQSESVVHTDKSAESLVSCAGLLAEVPLVL